MPSVCQCCLLVFSGGFFSQGKYWKLIHWGILKGWWIRRCNFQESFTLVWQWISHHSDFFPLVFCHTLNSYNINTSSKVICLHITKLTANTIFFLLDDREFRALFKVNIAVYQTLLLKTSWNELIFSKWYSHWECNLPDHCAHL